MNYLKICFVLLFCANISINLFAQPIPSGTITGSPPAYNVVGGAIITSGNTVTIAPRAVVQFNFGLRIDSGATLIVNNATIRMGDNQRILLMQPQFANAINHGGKLVLTTV